MKITTTTAVLALTILTGCAGDPPPPPAPLFHVEQSAFDRPECFTIEREAHLLAHETGEPAVWRCANGRGGIAVAR